MELQPGHGLKKTKNSHWCDEKLYLIWWRLRIVTMLMSEPVRFALLYSPDLPPTSCRTTYLHVSHLFPVRPAPLLVYLNLPLLPSWARLSVFESSNISCCLCNWTFSYLNCLGYRTNCAWWFEWISWLYRPNEGINFEYCVTGCDTKLTAISLHEKLNIFYFLQL